MPQLIKKKAVYVTPDDIERGFYVEPGFSYTFILRKKNVFIDVIEIEDLLFRKDSALLSPFWEDETEDDSIFQKSPCDVPHSPNRVSGISAIIGFFRYTQMCSCRTDAKKTLITGHSSSEESSPEGLSLQRAQVVASIIMGDVQNRSVFVANIVKHHTKEDEQHVLVWLSEILELSAAHPGKIDGKIGTQTHSAIRAVKKYFRSSQFPPSKYEKVSFNDDIDGIRATLENNVEFAANLWVIVFELYQAELQSVLCSEGIDIFQIRESSLWVDASTKAVGCGKTWSFETRGKNNYKSKSNRRVEILLYTPDRLNLDLPCKMSQCKEEECHIFKNVDKYSPSCFEPQLKWEYIELSPNGTMNTIRVQPLDYQRESLAGKEFLFFYDKTQTYSGTVPINGIVEVPFIDTFSAAILVVWFDKDKDIHQKWFLQIGELGSVETIPGAKVRLENLNYYNPTQDTDGGIFHAAIKSFQCSCGLDQSCELDDETQTKLTDMHGC